MELVIEAGCIIGMVLLAAFATPVLAGKRWNRTMRLRSGLVGMGLLVYVFINPRGAPDPFPVVVGISSVVAAIVGVLIGATLAWRFTHRARNTSFDLGTARSFGQMLLFGILALASFVAMAILAVGTVQALVNQAQYGAAPDCATSSIPSCKRQLQAEVIQISTASNPASIEVSVGGKPRTIQIQTAYDVLARIRPGQNVELTSWKGTITEVVAPGAGSMQTADGPGINLVIFAAFLFACGFLFLVFSAFGLVAAWRWRAGALRRNLPEMAA